MMKKQFFISMLVLFASYTHSQTLDDLYKPSDVKISYLGIDFSHVKLIGDFSQFAEAGYTSTLEIRDRYFPRWNKIVLAEPQKYDLKGMLRKGNIFFDIDMIMKLNSKAPLEDMESYNTPNYNFDDIKKFVAEYDLKNKKGLGVVFIAECLNKNLAEAYYHFVVLNLETKEILLHKRLQGKPRGFGLRNYWAGSIYDIIKDIRNFYYLQWKSELN